MLSHSSLSRLGKLLGYPALDKGMCHGFIGMLIQAMVIEDDKSFYTRLALITKYRKNFNPLIQKIIQLRHEIKKKSREIRDEDSGKKQKKKNQELLRLITKKQPLLEIPVFFEGTLGYLKSNQHRDLFGGAYVTQNDLKIIYDFFKSKKLETHDLSILLDKEAVFNKIRLKKWLIELKKISRQTPSALPIVLTNHNHTICIKYSRKNKRWIFVDINKLRKKTFYRKTNTKKLVKHIFKAFEDTEYSLFTTILLSIHPTKKLKNKAKKLDLKYPIKPKHVHLENSDQVRLLYIACQNGHLEVVKKLLQAGAKVNKAKEDGTTPLHVACQYGYLEIIKKLLQAGAKVNKTEKNGDTSLHITCHKGHLQIVKKLLQAGTNINQRNDDGETALYIACRKGHGEIVEELLKPKYGVKVNKARNNGNTSLHIACRMGHRQIVKKLLQAGANINQCNNDGETALYIACREGHLDIAEELLKSKYGVKVNKANNEDNTPLHIACQRGHLQIVKKLLQAGANINQCNDNGETALYIACREGHLDIAEELLKSKYGIKINKAKNNGNTSLHIACRMGYLQIVKKLLQAGANINQRNDDGETALYIACRKGHLDIVKELLKSKHGVNIDLSNNEDITPLHAVCLLFVTEKTALFNLLLENGASLTHKDSQGKTALDIAFAKNKTDFRTLLNYAEQNNLQSKDLMSANTHKKAIAWAKSKNLHEFTQYLLPDKKHTTLQKKGAFCFFSPSREERYIEENSISKDHLLKVGVS